MPALIIDVWTGLFFCGLILAIGLAATAQNIRSTRGPKERAFVVRSNLAAWIAISLFFTAWFFAPHPYSYMLLILYFVVFPFVVYRFCSTRLLIRRMEKIKATAAKKPEEKHEGVNDVKSRRAPRVQHTSVCS